MRNWLKYDLRWWLNRKREAFIMGIAWRLPKSVCYWAFIRMATMRNEAHHTVIDVLQANSDWCPR